METIPPVRAAKIRAANPVDFRPALLSAERVEGVERVMVDKAPQNTIVSDAANGIERDAVVFRNRKGLKPIHQVGDGDRSVAVARIEMEEIVPRRASGFTKREEL